MRRRSCAGNTPLEHQHLLRSARTAHLHRTPPRRMRLRMLQRRRRRLFALTYSTSLTLPSWTSKKLFNPPSHVYSAGSGDIFPHNVFYPSFSPMFSGVAVSISSIGKALSLCLQLHYQLFSCGLKEFRVRDQSIKYCAVFFFNLAYHHVDHPKRPFVHWFTSPPLGPVLLHSGSPRVFVPGGFFWGQGN